MKVSELKERLSKVCKSCGHILEDGEAYDLVVIERPYPYNDVKIEYTRCAKCEPEKIQKLPRLRTSEDIEVEERENEDDWRSWGEMW